MVKLLLMALVAICWVHSAIAQPVISIELVKCRESRILARQAQDLVKALTQLSLGETRAKDYLTEFQREVDRCETASQHEVRRVPPPMPPSPSLLDPGSLTGGRVVESRPSLTSAFLANAPQYLNAIMFSDLLDSYHNALAVQCDASFALAWIAPTKSLFESVIDDAAFGKCKQRDNRGSGKGDLPEMPALSSPERQCGADVLAALANLAVDNCAENPRASEATSNPGGHMTDEWKEANRKDQTTTTTADGKTTTTTTYEGKNVEGLDVAVVEETTTDAQGNLVRFESTTTIHFADGGTGTVTDVVDLEDGSNSHSEQLIAKNGSLVYRRTCDPECGPPVYGSAWTDLQKDIQAAREKTKTLETVIRAMEDVQENAKDLLISIFAGVFTGNVPLRRVKHCARFPGGDAKLYYKDDKGTDIDVAGMIHQCTCKARAARCPLCSVRNAGPATSCESAEEAKRRECLQNPFGPRDEVRKECVDLLQKDNPTVNLQALLCSNVRCTGNAVKTVSFSSGKALTCGCFAPSGDFTPRPGTTGFCLQARCDTGECRCQIEGGLRTCGCVAASETRTAPAAPPLALGPPVPPSPPH
jgi:hypothetical protein